MILLQVYMTENGSGTAQRNGGDQNVRPSRLSEAQYDSKQIARQHSSFSTVKWYQHAQSGHITFCPPPSLRRGP